MSDRPEDDRGAEGPRGEEQGGGPAAGRQAGGGPSPADRDAAGGSGGSGGYGLAQNQQFHQGQEGRNPSGAAGDAAQSRGERFDEEQGGGRGPDSVSGSGELQEDQAAHQDRGQSVAEAEAGRE